MNLNSNQEVFNMFLEFKNIYKHQIYNRYKRMSSKNLEELIEYLQNNDIKEEDSNIQVELNYYLEFIAKREKYRNNSFNSDLIILKLVKLKMDILHEILNNLDNEEVNYMSKIQAKKYINVKEFEEIYDISKSSQRDYRGRLHNPLPYHQKVFRGKILYDVDEIEKWFENEYK